MVRMVVEKENRWEVKKKHKVAGKPSMQSTAGAGTPAVPQPKGAPVKPGKIPQQCAYFASDSGCQKGDKRMYLHEMEGGRPKPAAPEDVARLEARAKVNPAPRPPSKPPIKKKKLQLPHQHQLQN